MAIYRKKKFTSPKKVGGPEIGAAHKSQKVGGPRLARPNRLRRQCGIVTDARFSVNFCRPTQCIGAVFAMTTWLSVCLSVCLSR